MQQHLRSTNGDLVEIREALRQFARERDWDQFHTPRNMILALAGEVGELAASVQWIPDAEIDEAVRVEPLRSAFADELADCLAYLVQIADRVGIDLGEAFDEKIGKNARKYPIALARGSAAKYTDLNGGRSQ